LTTLAVWIQKAQRIQLASQNPDSVTQFVRQNTDTTSQASDEESRGLKRLFHL
jgi:hypothetical protein